MKTLYISGQDKMSKIRQILLLKYIKIKKKQCSCIVIGKKLKQNNKFIEKVDKIGIPISDGKWLFKFLVIQIIEYISKCQHINMNKIKIGFATNESNDLIAYYIDELTKKSNKLKIITEYRKKFHNIEETLYYEKGIVLEISSNKRKGLQDVDIIFNFDFSEDILNKYKISEKAIIINFKEKINITAKRFSGININSYKIDFNNIIMNMLEWTKKFEETELYESYIYRNDRVENIEKDILKDKVIIKSLIGNNGEISKKEYQNVLDKTCYLS